MGTHKHASLFTANWHRWSLGELIERLEKLLACKSKVQHWCDFKQDPGLNVGQFAEKAAQFGALTFGESKDCLVQVVPVVQLQLQCKPLLRLRIEVEMLLIGNLLLEDADMEKAMKVIGHKEKVLFCAMWGLLPLAIHSTSVCRVQVLCKSIGSNAAGNK